MCTVLSVCKCDRITQTVFSSFEVSLSLMHRGKRLNTNSTYHWTYHYDYWKHIALGII